MSSSPLVNSLVKNRLQNQKSKAPDIDKPPFQFIHTMDLSVVGTMLHDSPDLVIHRTEIWVVWRPQAGHKKVWRLRRSSIVACARPGVQVHCPAGTQSLSDTLRFAGSSVWHHLTSWSSIEDVSKIYHQNFLLCNKQQWNYRMHCIFIISFWEEMHAVAFFKVVQQQTIGKVGNSIICL